MTSKAFVLLDRDGTVVAEKNYLSDPGQIELIPGAADGLRKLRWSGLGLLIITNQSGVGRGYFDEATLGLIHRRLLDLLQAEGVSVDGIYHCPHTPEEGCNCRKPRTGLAEVAARDHQFDPRSCFVIGDKSCDIDMGRNIGATTILVRTGYGSRVEAEGASRPDHVVDDLREAAALVERLSARGGLPGAMKPVSYRETVLMQLLESAETKRRTAADCLDEIIGAAEVIAGSFRAGGKVLLCGNGGSAADCQHMATEFVSRLSKEFERPGLPAIALTTDTSFLTAFANDCGYDGVFERQVQTLGSPGDVLIAISTSGNSTNVMGAVRAAQSIGMQTIALTGATGRLNEMADICVAVPSTDTNRIQEAHLAIEHALCFVVERMMFGSDTEVRVELGNEQLMGALAAKPHRS
jgi:phosphoheptose isomerase